ncbi:lipocalin family protein [Flagellimonas sp.]|uniref:lipocalin family protein n=1 Tax=Flagellimonas sp. TaxID=2058762 RepID=UPI003B5C7424
MKRIKLKKRFYYVILVLTIGCSENDIDHGNIDNFYSGADSSASEGQLKGIWSIFSAEFDGERTDVPANYSECNRDFFVYSENGTYSEYIYQSGDCRPQIDRLDWSLDGGVVTLSNSFGQSDDVVITKLGSQELVFKSRFDVDQDGELDVLILFARRYEPTDVDFYSQTFNRNYDDEFENLISFNWDAYNGANMFNRYEIFRSENCSKNNAELIATITDADQNQYTDINPPPREELCYFIRIYVNNELLGESLQQSISPQSLKVPTVNLAPPTVQDSQIMLNWEPYKGEYFSHYLITVNNREPGWTLDDQEVVLAEITDKSVVTFTDETPPYFSNPVYAVKTINIFGTVSFTSPDYANSSQEVEFIREEMLGLLNIEFVTIDKEEPIIYFYGRELNAVPPTSNILKFNYETQRTEAVSNNRPTTSFGANMKLINSSFGKELLVEQGDELYVYDAFSLEFKSALTDENVFYSIDDFTFLGDDLFMFINTSEVFTFRRETDRLVFLDRQPHTIENGNSSGFQVISIGNNQVIAGHFNSSTSLLYAIDENGLILSDPQVLDVRYASDYRDETLYNQTSEFILNTTEKQLYSTQTFDVIETLTQPNFPSGTSIDGNLILGSNNDPEWPIEQGSLHKKEAVILDRTTGEIETLPTIGYPHIVFEDANGKIISISSGLKRDRLTDFTDRAEIFVEIIDSP